MNANWYVLRSKPRKELYLAGELLARNLETFCPILHVKPVNPRASKIKPYFPGYLFIHIDLQSINLSSILWMPGMVGPVWMGNEPAFVPDELVRTVRKKVDEINAAGSKIWAGMQVGDRVLVEDGPFVGYQGIFDGRLSGDDRVRILLDLVKNRQMRLDLSVSQIKHVKTC